MDQDMLLTILEHSALAAVLYFLLQRVMGRLDAVTDKLIAILERQDRINSALFLESDDWPD